MSEKKLYEIQMAFKASGHKFHLTGSRYFGNPHSKSDWDYIVQDCLNVGIFLRDLGFHYIKDREHYNDTNIISVYSLQYGREPWQKIDVQCSRDVQEKIRAQNYISRFFPLGLSTDKKLNSNIWEMALHHLLWLNIKENEKSKPPSTLEDKANRLKEAWKR